jgi:SAM-dependent methyltransferase
VSAAVAQPVAAALPRTGRRARPELLLAGLAFFVSGASGLVYQVTWQRILALHSGVGIYSIAMIVGAFMAGLGVGSHYGGLFSLRVDARRSLRLFAMVELAIGLFGALSCWLYYDLLYLKAAWMYTPAWRAGILHFAGLFLPTFLMGTSLPFLVRALVSDLRTAGRTIGLLYGINLLGAACGAALTPWVLIRILGMRDAVLVAAVGNALAGILGLAAGRFLRADGDADTAADAPGALSAPPVPQRYPLWLALYALSGFCALALEILWFRVLEMAVKSTAFTFGTVLALYLLGAALGCLAGAPLVERMKAPLKIFLLLQCALLVYSGVAIALLVTLPTDTPVYAWYTGYWGKGWFGLGTTWEPQQFWHLYVLLPAAIFAIPTVLMGLSFPTLQRAVLDDLRTSGRKVGLLQAANIAGCVAGSLLVGLLALDHVRTTGTIRALMVLGLVFAAVGARHFGWRSAFAPLALALAVLAVVMPGQRAFWMRLHGADDPAVLLKEDASGVGALVPKGDNWVVFVHGKSHSWIPFGGIHSRLGAAPSMIHPAPLDVAIIGLGSGDTAWASASRPETRSLTVFEISGPQPVLLRQLADRQNLPELKHLLDDPRLRIRVADGRNALEQEGALYDVIEADALWPIAPYSGNLYSVEFFQQCMRRLKPGGILCTWAPTPRVYASFTQAAPYIAGLGDRSVLFGSNQPIEIDVETWRRRALSPEVVAYLGRERAEGAAWLLERVQALHRYRRRQLPRNMNFDLFPRDEFHSPN